MANTTTNYGLYKPESTDTYNHLVYDNPNMDTIDATMKDNADHGIDSASCIKTGTVHSVTRSNTSCPVFRFTATGDWNAGDTMNVDGTPVSVFLPNGSAAITGAYLINTEVIASIIGSRVTLMSNAADSTSVYFDNIGTTLTATNVGSALAELNSTDASLAGDITNAIAYTTSVNNKLTLQNLTNVAFLSVNDGRLAIVPSGQNNVPAGTPYVTQITIASNYIRVTMSDGTSKSVTLA